MPSSVMPPPSTEATPNGVAPTAVTDLIPNGRHQDPQPNHAPRSPLLAKLTSLASIATVAAAAASAALAGFILILLGGVLFLLPLVNWQVNLRGRLPALGA